MTRKKDQPAVDDPSLIVVDKGALENSREVARGVERVSNMLARSGNPQAKRTLAQPAIAPSDLATCCRALLAYVDCGEIVCNWKSAAIGPVNFDGMREALRAIDAAPALLEVLKIAADHLAQYRAYAEDMRAIGRGASISSEFQPEYLASMIDKAISGVRRLA